MRRSPRRYDIPGTDDYITGSKLKQLTSHVQKQIMKAWFDESFDPPDGLPYDSSEGGYQWIWGGPYDAREKLENEFGGAVKDKLIEELADELSDRSPEWSGKPEYDYDADYIEEYIKSGANPYLTLTASLEEISSAAKITAPEKERKTIHKLLFANIITTLETFLGDLFVKTLSLSDKYTEDFVLKTKHFQDTQIPLSKIFDHVKKIDAEVRSYILAHNWHMLKESAAMYKRAFNVTFPDTPDVISIAIRQRHDIVHRNGKTKEGTEGSWGVTEIRALKEAVLSFANLIDSEVKCQTMPATTSITPQPDTPNEPIEM